LAGRGLSVDDQGFHELMDEARLRARGSPKDTAEATSTRDRVMAFARAAAAPSRFVGYEALEADTELTAVERDDGRLLVKLEESPFYPEGGGQVSDAGVVETPAGRARVADVFRLGDDQALALEAPEGSVEPGAPVRALVDRAARRGVTRNHTATHLLHAALRQRLGTHVRQAGSYVGPDKLRFDFTHGERLSPDELRDVEERVSGWVEENHRVHAVTTTRAEAQEKGAMALFGEKYGEWVRMVEVEDVSRELCGGTHVATTAEIGLFHLTTETSSASNVRRIEAVTGPAGVEMFRSRTGELRELASLLRVPEHDVVGAVRRLSEQVQELKRRPAEDVRDARAQADELVARAEELRGVRVVGEVVEAEGAKPLLELADRVRQTLGTGVVALGCAVDGRAHLAVVADPVAVERGVSAAEVVRAAAPVAGGGGGGRDTMAQAGGRSPERLPEAIAAARVEIQRALGV